MIDQRRIHILNQGEPGKGPVLYWMHRDHRARDNFGLLHAQNIALERGVSLAVAYCLASKFLDATIRQFGFLLRGLEETAAALADKSIPFVVLTGDPAKEIPRYVRDSAAGLLVTDFDSLRIKRGWLAAVSKELDIPVHEVDSRNVVPCRAVSDKREYAARTIRPKIHRLLPEFLHEPPDLRPHPHAYQGHVPDTDWAALRDGLHVDRSVPEVDWISPGEQAASGMLGAFIRHRLDSYADKRNDPNGNVTSQLSPYLHFGMLSPLRAALAVSNARSGSHEGRESFLEELVVRRELSDNFCLHTPDYDSADCFPDWAEKTLAKHEGDVREYVYDPDTFEAARTHDELWNAAQKQMVASGYMHGYMRMYWAKKILEWTKTPQDAMDIAIYLNDRYELDGRDANGYTGVAWSIGGVHDRAWKERSVFGTVRFMSYGGAKSKFDVKGYVAAMDELWNDSPFSE
ncbi:deoxyribodipyrimidine photolyase [Oceanidesulfovibrio indonesiensis]|uniref:Deoxyribodipyrimidine photo-lyase n=1 Tax=Oceanidesulfovibrio indonesiensis TaxID=54767 RepID=A0A7M3MFQ3_9BACT|nr:deoxyribodipyrimidine photo-lyase [Oceanidesulfovibrio indonesiensis]TVM17610.1 deoxyribodipyrimidine photolyase [Oceanidesulfovibrio indonesiensis]